MIVVKTLAEMRRHFSQQVCEKFLRSDLEDGLKEDDDLDEYCGGYFYVVTSEQDLKAVPVVNPIIPTENANITNSVQIWDVAEKISEDWAILLYITNDAGGNVYFIPKKYWDTINLKEQIYASYADLSTYRDLEDSGAEHH